MRLPVLRSLFDEVQPLLLFVRRLEDYHRKQMGICTPQSCRCSHTQVSSAVVMSLYRFIRPLDDGDYVNVLKNTLVCWNGVNELETGTFTFEHNIDMT